MSAHKWEARALLYGIPLVSILLIIASILYWGPLSVAKEREPIIVSILVTTLQVLALVAAFGVLVVFLLKLTRRTPELVMEGFANQTAVLSNAPVNLDQLVRERLAREIDLIHDQLDVAARPAAHGTLSKYDVIDSLAPEADSTVYLRRLHDALPPGDDHTGRLLLNAAHAPDEVTFEDQQHAMENLSKLASSLSDISKPEVGAALEVLGQLFPASGMRITGMLQQRGAKPDQVGIGFEIVDMPRRQSHAICTMWEPSASPPNTRDVDVAQGLHDIATQLLFLAATSSSTNTLAPLVLGEVYETTGEWDRARKQYEHALKRQPLSLPAIEGLERVVEHDKINATNATATKETIVERYIGLLPAAVRWVALETTKCRMLAKCPNKPRRKASIHYFFGSAYWMSSADYPQHRDVFLRYAIRSYCQAALADNTWWLPYSALALRLSIEGQTKGKVELQRQAIQLYDMARMRAATKSVDVADKLKLDQAIAQLLTADAAAMDKAITSIQTLEQDWLQLGVHCTADTHAHFLYNLACCYGIASTLTASPSVQRLGVERVLKQRCVRYLVSALVLDRRLWDGLKDDQDLPEDCRPIDRLQNELRSSRYLCEVQEWAGKEDPESDMQVRRDLQNTKFKDEVEAVVNKVL